MKTGKMISILPAILLALSLSNGFVSSANAGFPYRLQKDRQKHLLHCPASPANNGKTFSRTFYEVQIKPEMDSDSLPLMTLDEPNIIEVNSDITAN